MMANTSPSWWARSLQRTTCLSHTSCENKYGYIDERMCNSTLYISRRSLLAGRNLATSAVQLDLFVRVFQCQTRSWFSGGFASHRNTMRSFCATSCSMLSLENVAPATCPQLWNTGESSVFFPRDGTNNVRNKLYCSSTYHTLQLNMKTRFKCQAEKTYQVRRIESRGEFTLEANSCCKPTPRRYSLKPGGDATLQASTSPASWNTTPS